MAAATFTMRQLLEAGVHFGHHTRRWNPKMERYIFGERNGIHILEVMNTGPLVKDNVNEFLFVLGQAKVKGAVQMIINPIAIR